MFNVLICVVLVVLAAITGPARADTPSPDFLLTAFADNQQRLRSGVVRMEGQLLSRSGSRPSLEGPVSLFCAFDADARLFRFDRSEPVRPPSLSGGKITPPDAPPVPGGGKVTQTPTRFVAWSREHPKSVQLLPTGYTPKQLAPFARQFNPRILGLANGVTVKHDRSPDELVPSLRKRLAKTNASVTEVRPGVTRVRWTEGDGGLEIDFDQAVGFMPVRYADIQLAEGGKPAEPVVTAATTWKLRSGAYVPVTARFQQTGDDSPYLTRYDLKLTWDVVNGPVDEKLTTVRGLGLPPDTLISDNTGGERGKSLGKVGDATPNPGLKAAETRPQFAPQPEPPPPDRRLWQWVAGGAVVLLAAVVVWRLRRR